MAVLSAAGMPLFDWLAGSGLIDRLSDWGSMNYTGPPIQLTKALVKIFFA